ncbi:MAG: GAF domain-containing protein [Gammaproteobacteria bacterium]
MSFNRRDIIQMLRRENELLKTRNRQLSDRLTRYQQAFRALDRMDDTMRGMSTEIDIENLINEFLALALHACDSENGSLILIDEVTGELVFVDVIGDARDHLINHRIDKDTGVVGRVVTSRKAELVTDVQKSAGWSAEIDEVVGFKTQALMCAPLFSKEKTYGAIEVINSSSTDDFNANDLSILRVTARFVSQALQMAEEITRSKDKEV